MALPLPPSGLVPVVGIDDFSFRRGKKFGTILVNLKLHKVIDVLSDRCAETSAAWMRTHPEIEIISRDRGEDYAAAARLGAPQARQVADRFHLTKNLGETLETIVKQSNISLRVTDETPIPSLCDLEQAQSSPQEIRPAPSKKAEEVRLTHRLGRQERYAQVKALREQGFKLAAIAHRTGVSQRTVVRWLSSPCFPEKKRRRAEQTQLEDYHAYLCERWRAGVQNATHLFRELTHLGYTGCYMSVYTYLTCLRTGVCLPTTPIQPTIRTITARQTAFLFLRSSTDLKPEERQDLAMILSRSSELTLLYQFAQRFQKMIHHRSAERLDDWMEQVLACPCPELHRFVTGLRQDYDAVKAALTDDWSNGQVEGQVNRLKLIKRMMFGRAGFALLRQRVLHAL
jgi:transposase